MGKFKVGDNVKLRFDARFGRDSEWGQGRQIGTVAEIRGQGSWPVRVDFPKEKSVPCAEDELELAIVGQPAICYTRKTKLQLVQIIENQKAEITKLVKEIEGLKNLKPAIAVQPVQAGQLVETVKRTRPKVGEFVNFTQHELKPGDVIYAPTVGNATVKTFQLSTFTTLPAKYEALISYSGGNTGFACVDWTWKVVSLVDAPKVPPLDPKKAWIKKDGTGIIGAPGLGWHYKFTSDPRYDDARGSWVVDVAVIEKDGRQSASYENQGIGIDWQPYTPEKPKTFWDLVKVGDKVKVSLTTMGKVDRTYIGRVYRVGRSGTYTGIDFIVDKTEGKTVWRLGESAGVSNASYDLGPVEILKD